MEKMIMIPEWRYDKMLESLDRAAEELAELRERLKNMRENVEHGED